MTRKKIKIYDDDALVLAIARGDKSYPQVAKDFGLSRQMVHFIATGVCRPELLERIEDVRRAFEDQARRLAARMATVAMARLVKLIGPEVTPTPDVQRKAAVDILRFALGDPSKPQVNVLQAQKNEGVTVSPAHAAEFYRWLAEKEGWEDDEPPAAGPRAPGAD